VTNLNQELKTRLKGAKRVAVLGIGSDLRQDDAAGILVAAQLDKAAKKKKNPYGFKAYLGETAPENLTGEIKRYKPTHLIIVDTIDIKEKPGTILLLSPEMVASGISFSTHKLPAEVLVNYFMSSFKCQVMIIGIQPGSLDFDKIPSKDVKGAAKEVSAAIKKAVPSLA
jgi:hydrogenase 3 maturation protease